MRILIAVLAVAIAVYGFSQSRFNGTLNHAQMTLGTGGGVHSADMIKEIYENETTSSGFYFPVGAGAVVADDLHMIDTGHPVTGFSFGYYSPNTAPTASFYFWANDPVDGTFGPLLAAFKAGPLNIGAWAYTFDLEPNLVFGSPKDIWMGVSFDNDAGWLEYNPPGIGASHDLFWRPDIGGLYNFGGKPPANFFANIWTTPEPSTFVAIGVGLMGLLGLRRRK